MPWSIKKSEAINERNDERKKVYILRVIKGMRVEGDKLGVSRV